MQRHRQIVSAAAAVLAWVAPAYALPPDPDDEYRRANVAVGSVPAEATWILVDARNHASGVSGAAAVLLGVARERGRSRPASLRVECFGNVTAVHVDAAALQLGRAATVLHSVDGGPFRPASWEAGADGSGLSLSADRAIAFLAELYGKGELRLAVVRPLSVPFVLTFAVAGAEQNLGAIAERCQWSAAPALSEAGR
jgi:hypothetical protein